MREILYRGMNHETGKFVYGFYTKLLNGARITHNIIVEDEQAESRFTQYYIHSKETVGQYTGLTDKNGAKIFDGDRVACKHTEYEVDFYRGAFRIGSFSLLDSKTSLEIIGNIHE